MDSRERVTLRRDSKKLSRGWVEGGVKDKKESGSMKEYSCKDFSKMKVVGKGEKVGGKGGRERDLLSKAWPPQGKVVGRC
ncbi:hypothetical protein H6P81_019692 [Aristolochia fimbriata]|uniref:Uncharacterized protein n=1 Tax=Aristolochia fimbriata TaxID=158543 RepID=A0AAV7DWA9_ARIFI|nr:hypothetical protein H6P81_019692 [Aristolochia fimbriata]